MGRPVIRCPQTLRKLRTIDEHGNLKYLASHGQCPDCRVFYHATALSWYYKTKDPEPVCYHNVKCPSCTIK